MIYRGVFFFFFNDTATTEIYTLSLHDALPISENREAGTGSEHKFLDRTRSHDRGRRQLRGSRAVSVRLREARVDRKSTRLNSSHSQISYAVFCLKKKTRTD